MAAESVTPNRDNTVWAVRLRDGVEFHHGKTLTPEDVMFSLAKVTDPKKLGSIVPAGDLINLEGTLGTYATVQAAAQ